MKKKLEFLNMRILYANKIALNDKIIILMFQVDEESRGGFWSQCDVETS